MLSHELEDSSVSHLLVRRYCWPLLISHRFATYLYQAEGKVVTDRLWEETLTELEFADVRTILKSMKG